jgi:rhodanese-related sulfurtransferase
VQWITTRELADWLEDRHRPPPVLLDVRTVEEWNVSHLPGARRVDLGACAEMALPGAARDVPVVTYCAVGYRSTEFTTRLRRACIPTANLGDSSWLTTSGQGYN